MSDLNTNTRYGGAVARSQAEIDQGLRSYMLGVYNYMAIGLAITGLFALGIYMLSISGTPTPYQIRGGLYLTQLGYTLFVSPLKWVVILAPLAIVFFLSFGVSLAVLLMVYTHTSIARVFFITAASFGALSLWGYTTQRDLSGWGSFLFIGLIGIILASLVNIFVASTMMQWIISCVGVLVFAGLTAYDTQQIKEMYDVNDDGTVAGKKSIMGALRLYLDFLNMFMMLLQLFGNRE
jgi:FtsH-binding integral membrane protein